MLIMKIDMIGLVKMLKYYAGYISSDRTIKKNNRDIWKLEIQHIMLR